MCIGAKRAAAWATAFALVCAGCGTAIFEGGDAGSPGGGAGGGSGGASAGGSGGGAGGVTGDPSCSFDSQCNAPVGICFNEACVDGCGTLGCPNVHESGALCNFVTGHCFDSDGGTVTPNDAGSGGGSGGGSAGGQGGGAGGGGSGSGGGSGGGSAGGQGGGSAGGSAGEILDGGASSTLCHSCNDNDQCDDGAGLCENSQGERYCGQDCSTASCPDGYDCEESSNGHARQCHPADGGCAVASNNPSSNANGSGMCGACNVNQDCLSGSICDLSDADGGSGICELPCNPNNTEPFLTVTIDTDCASQACLTDIANNDFTSELTDCLTDLAACDNVPGTQETYCIPLQGCVVTSSRRP